MIAKPDIGAEFISPAKLNDVGQSLTHDILNDYRPEYISCLENIDPCFNEKQRQIAISMDYYWTYINGNKSFDVLIDDNLRKMANKKKEWLQENNFTPSESSLYRGRILHHYSTITYPYLASFRDGFLSIVTAQYGAISILPLYLTSELNFNIYNALSFLIVLIVVLGLSFHFYRAHPSKTKSLTSVILIFFCITVALNQGAIYIGAGFNALRYLPIAAMIWMSLIHPDRITATLFFSVFALLNSIQFNILFCLSSIFLVLVEYFTFRNQKGKWWRSPVVNMAARIIIIFFVVCLQFMLIQKGAWSFPISLFGSLGDPSKIGLITQFGYGLMVLAFPLLALTLIQRNTDWTQNQKIIRATIYCGTFSSYAFSFPGSPQHFVGYLLLAAPALFFLIRIAIDKTFIFLIAAIGIFTLPVAYNKYVSTPAQIERPIYDVYLTKPIGKSLRFLIANDVQAIDSEIKSLIGDKTPNIDQIYFLIREKNLLELNAQRAYYPSAYDPFANLEAVKVELFPIYLKNFRWLVTYSPDYMDQMRRLLGHASGRIISPLEAFRHLELLDHNDRLIRSVQHRDRRCSLRYCVFDLEPLSPS
jgi:hypothetical protein